MRWLAQLRMRVQMLFLRGKAGARLDDELQFHLERQIAENVAAGMNAEEARYAALRAFGNPALLREQARATWSWGWLESLLRDLRIGVRTLARTPGFAAIAILVMALGIGANVALFTVVRGVLLKPLPYKDPNQLVALYEHSADDQYPYNIIAPGVFAEWQKQNRTFSSLARGASRRRTNHSSGTASSRPSSNMTVKWYSLMRTAVARGASGRSGMLSISACENLR